ncbi:MAG: L,D-transpeptidase family protein [Bacteroidaceae bacterium]|nr:L,D-transpeptidase family protein [Bacteroidaceae bacterium]
MKLTIKLWMMAAILTLCTSVFTCCTSNEDNPATKGQLLEVYDVNGSEAKARLTINGRKIFTTDVYVGKNGIGKASESDTKTPTGTLHVLRAFGVKPNPGTAIPYIDVTPSVFACDEEGPYYNQVIDTAAVHHYGCKGEDMYHIVPQYNYGLTTDYNSECVWPEGSNIFIHCKGPRPYTGGCIAFDEDKMIEILRRCDLSLVITVKE